MATTQDTETAEAVRFPLPSKSGGRYTPPPEKTESGDILGHATQTVRADAQTLYELWRDVGSIPRWQEFVVSVERLDNTTSHWVLGDPEDKDGKRVSFDAKITEDVPGKKLSWSSTSEGVDLSGTVTFEPVDHDRGTRVTLKQRVTVPAGAFGNAIAGIALRSPRQVVIENLRHFKQLVETGEVPSVAGQPHGPRGISGGFKRWLYGETNPTPTGTQDKA